MRESPILDIGHPKMSEIFREDTYWMRCCGKWQKIWPGGRAQNNEWQLRERINFVLRFSNLSQ